jgi:hypothetical protein
MTGFDCRIGLLSAFGLTALFLASAPQVAADGNHDAAARITELCLMRQADDEACRCLSRETASRFEPDQLQIIAAAMEAGKTASDISASLVEQGVDEAEVASFTHRLDTAHIVIRQTCVASFFERDNN